jgi:hypothetical protein
MLFMSPASACCVEPIENYALAVHAHPQGLLEPIVTKKRFSESLPGSLSPACEQIAEVANHVLEHLVGLRALSLAERGYVFKPTVGGLAG